MFPRISHTSTSASTTEPSVTSIIAKTTTQNIEDTINASDVDLDYWANAVEDDFFSAFPFESADSGFWDGKFVPPPPRPPFLEESIVSDGLTTCDLCSWAWKDKGGISEVAAELGWTFTLVIVSVLSAILGACIMITLIKCKRTKPNANGRPMPWWYRSSNRNTNDNGSRNNMLAKSNDDRSLNLQTSPNASPINVSTPNSGNSGVWTWLTNRRQPTAPEQLGSPRSQHHLQPHENHYTHMDENYCPVVLGGNYNLGSSNLLRDHRVMMERRNGSRENDDEGGDSTGEALYAELDRESIQSGTNPSYQNTAYSQCGENDIDMPMVSSAPSSAYYSDLSVTAISSERPYEKPYEVVGLSVMSSPMPNWTSTLENTDHSSLSLQSQNPLIDNDCNSGSTNFILANRVSRTNRPLSSIKETTSIPSEYV